LIVAPPAPAGKRQTRRAFAKHGRDALQCLSQIRMAFKAIGEEAIHYLDGSPRREKGRA
jgi:hypothetical protein